MPHEPHPQLVAGSDSAEAAFQSTQTGRQELLFWFGVKAGGFGLAIALSTMLPLVVAWGAVLWFYIRYGVSYTLPFGKKVRRADHPVRYWIGFGAQAAVFVLWLTIFGVEVLGRLGVRSAA